MTSIIKTRKINTFRKYNSTKKVLKGINYGYLEITSFEGDILKFGNPMSNLNASLIIKKPNLTTKVRKRADVEKVYEQRKIDREERMASKPKRLGGNRRPKSFTFNDEDENKES